ncbi:MAG: hypothetical protein U0872_11470 [Planctomycetaceae bacterium]
MFHPLRLFLVGFSEVVDLHEQIARWLLYFASASLPPVGDGGAASSFSNCSRTFCISGDGTRPGDRRVFRNNWLHEDSAGHDFRLIAFNRQRHMGDFSDIAHADHFADLHQTGRFAGFNDNHIAFS